MTPNDGINYKLLQQKYPSSIVINEPLVIDEDFYSSYDCISLGSTTECKLYIKNEKG